MNGLFIGGQKVVLPKGFSQTFTEENPFFSKNGQYTFDIQLSLKHPTNAKIYKHYNRINNSADLVTKRSAVFVSDNRVWLNGTEVILEINSDSVSIQLVSGNSELNYLIGGDLKIRTLDLGTAVIDPATIVSNLDHPYPENDWLLLPFTNNGNDYLGNDYFHPVGVVNDGKLQLYPLHYAYDGIHPLGNTGNIYHYLNYRPQPYLCFIINKILSSLGYALSTNMLANHEVFKYYYLVHGYDTLKFAEMLPDWTAKTFFEEIEKYFDCSVVIKDDKTVDILFNHSYLSRGEPTKLSVIDEFSCEIDSENKLSHFDINMGYALDSDDYYQWNRLEQTVYAKAIHVDLEELLPVLDLLEKVADTNDASRYRKIFHDIHLYDQYIAFKDGASDIPKKINCFGNLYYNPDDNETINMEFKIIPAAMKTGSRKITCSGGSDLFSVSFYWQCPIAEYADPFFIDNENSQDDYTLQSLISGENSVASKTLTTKLRLAIYDGQKPKSLFNYRTIENDVLSPYPNATGSNLEYPFPFVESKSEYFRDLNSLTNFFSSNPFRLSWMYNNLYSLTEKINTEKLYKFVCIESGRFDVKSTFLINNREFICAKIERIATDNGLNKLVTGYFYPIG